MIQSKLGEVKITRPDYKLCDVLSCSKSDVDMCVEVTLGADLTSILGVLGDIYGSEHALGMWTRTAEIYIDVLKGDYDEL